MSVSVVIPTFNRVGSLQDVLNGLRRQTMRSFEVVIVNGPSTDGTAAYVASLGDTVRSVENTERNLSISRNLGIAAAAGDLVAFLDDDAVPEPRWLEELVAAFDDDRVAAAGGLVLDHTGVRVQWRHLVASRTGEHDFDQQPPLDRFVRPGADPFLYVAGGNCAFRRAALAEIEGFDEEIEYNFDEAEICLRLLDAGWLLRSLERAVVHHRNLPSHQRSAVAFTDPFFAVKNRLYFGLRNGSHGRETGPALADATRDLGRLRVAARGAARAGRLTPDTLARYLGRADAGFHVGLQRGLHGRRRGRRLPPPDPDGLRRFPVLDPPQRRRIALVAPAPGAAARLADEGHDVHELRPGAADDLYRIDYDAGVWVHQVPVGPRWLPELDGTPLRAPLEQVAALRAAFERVRRDEPAELVGGPPPPFERFLDADLDELVALLAREGLAPAAAARVAARLLESQRFPVDYEPTVRACLGEPDDGHFVDGLYAALLGRPPERFGREMALGELRAGLPRRTLVERVAGAPEARGRGVDPAFVAHLPELSVTQAGAELRAAWLLDDPGFARRTLVTLVGDEAAADAAARRLRNRVSRQALVAELCRRPEVAERIPGAEHLPPADVRTAPELRHELERLAPLPAPAFVDAAYRLLLGRPADPAGLAEYVGALAADRDRAWVLRTLARSSEAVARGLGAAAVDGALRRSPRYRLAALRRRVDRRVRRVSGRGRSR
jgi:GT2 family glycosyltransferase